MKKELYELEQVTERPNTSNIRREVISILSKVRLMDSLDTVEDIRGLKIESDLIQLLDIIENEQKKLEEIKSIAFMLANKL